MDNWLDRLIREQEALSEKITNGSDVDNNFESTKLKTDQLYYMEQYLDILNKRLRLESKN